LFYFKAAADRKGGFDQPPRRAYKFSYLRLFLNTLQTGAQSKSCSWRSYTIVSGISGPAKT